jgi:copper(I)-binding protein
MSEIMRPLIAGLLTLAVTVTAASGTFAADLQISGAWARATPPGAKVGGGYLTVQNNGAADKLLGASGTIANRIELHEHSMEGGVMKMRQVPAIDVPMHSKVSLQPGGYHIMFIGLKAPLKAGDMVMLTLKFEKGGEMMVHMPIMKAPPAGNSGMGHDHTKQGDKKPAN